MQYSWKNPLKAFAVVLLLAAYAGAAFGAAGNVQFVIGDAKLITRTGVTRALQKGAEVNEGDRIVTAADASAQIRMVDGGFIAIRPNTDMGFDTYRYSGKEDGTESAVVSLLQGGFRTITGVIGRTNKQNYLIRTETATIGIRGTDHEPMVILPPAAGQIAIAPAGTYDKVNVGVAFIRNDAGSIDIQRNQVGFAPVTRAAPVILPAIPPFFKPTPAPGPQKAKDDSKKDGGQGEAAPIRNTAVVDPTSTTAAAPAATPVATAPVVEIKATDASGLTVNATTQTLTTTSGATTSITPGSTPPPPPPPPAPTVSNPVVATGNYGFAVLGAAPVTGGVELVSLGSETGTSAAANTNFVLNNNALAEMLKSPYQRVGLNSQTLVANAGVKFSGGIASDLFSDPNGSYYMGRWTGGQIAVADLAPTSPVAAFADSLGSASVHWLVGLLPGNVAGTSTNNVQQLTGGASYALAAATHPTDGLGNVGTLNSASLTADFSAQTVDSNLNLSFSSADLANPSKRNLNLTASATKMPIQQASFGAAVVAPTVAGVPVDIGLNNKIVCSGADCAAAGYVGTVGGAFLAAASGGTSSGAVGTNVGLNYGFFAIPASTSAPNQPFSEFISGAAVLSTASTPVVLTGGPFAAYSAANTAVTASGWESSRVAAADLTYSGGGLVSAIDRDFGGGRRDSFSFIGVSGLVTANANSNATTGIQFGRWANAAELDTSSTIPLGARSAPRTWMYGPMGYLDPGITASGGQMFGTFNYVLDGATAPYDRQSGRSGTLTSASLSANFTNSTFGASLGLNVGGQLWSASTVNNPLFSGSSFSASTSFSSTVIGGIQQGQNLSISTGKGTPTACPTCFGSLSGAFTGQNYAGAILSYELGNSSDAGGDVVGHAALARSGTAITNAAPATTGKYFVADFGGGIQLPDTVSTSGNVLTGYAFGSPTSPANGFNSTAVTCVTCTVTAAAATTGIYFGTWDAGSYSFTNGSPLAGTTDFLNWITGPEAGPLFLPHALTGTKTFVFDGGIATNRNGIVGNVLNTTSLTADFNRQVVGINIDVSINDTAVTPKLHAWSAKTLPGNEPTMNGGSGIGGAMFQAFTSNSGASNPSGSGTLTVTVDGKDPGTGVSGFVYGQFTGTGLNGAILRYAMQGSTDFGAGTTPSFERVRGVAAFAAPASDIATPHRSVMMAATDPVAIVTQQVLGMYANAPSRMQADAAGNLTQFDMNTIDNSGPNNPSHTLSIGTAVLSDAGKDPISGISWGRWAGGSINVANRADGTSKSLPLAGSLHWIAGPTETSAVTLPVSGTFSYVKAGGTAPTDNLGNVGVLNSATLTANFTAQTVDVGVNASIAGATLAAGASAVPIIQRTAFAAGTDMPAPLTVTCTGACGTTHQGTILGGFTGAGAIGAAMSYSLEKIGGANASITSGVVGFRR